MNTTKMIGMSLLGGLVMLASCGTSKLAQNSTGASNDKSTTETKTSTVQQSEAVKKLSFVQKVSDNQVYAKNIVGNIDFTLQTDSKEFSLGGSLHMRKNEVIRIQLFAPLVGFEVGRLEFTPTYVLVIDRINKQYVKADYNQVSFLQRQGISFYSLQALFWNQLLLPGTQTVSESDLKKFDVCFGTATSPATVSYKEGNMDYAWTADQVSGRITQAEVAYKAGLADASKLQLQYSNFKSVGVKQFPATQVFVLTTQATKQPKKASFTINMKDVKTDSNWDAQTEVSAKYKQVSPEDVLGKIMNMGL